MSEGLAVFVIRVRRTRPPINLLTWRLHDPLKVAVCVLGIVIGPGCLQQIQLDISLSSTAHSASTALFLCSPH